MCPTCRRLAVIDDTNHGHGDSGHHRNAASSSPIVKGLIDNMDVMCRHQLDHEEALQRGEEKCAGASSSSNGDDSSADDTGDSTRVKHTRVINCNWTGKLSEYPSHLESKMCPLQKTQCLGCDSLHRRGYLKSGYCHNSECVLLAARSVLDKKERMDANVILSKCVVLEARSVLDKKQTMDEKESEMVGMGTNTLKIETIGNADKENRCMNEDSLLLRSASKLKAMTPTNHHRQEHHQQPQQPPNTPLATRVYIQADAPELSAITSSFSTCKDDSKDSCLIPTSWGVIQDSAVNSVRFVSRLDSHADSDVVNCRSQSSKKSNKTKNSSKITVVPNNQNKYNDAFLLTAVKVQVVKELAKQQLQSDNTTTPMTVKAVLVHQYIVDFCSHWIRRKPHALFDFVVYRPGNNLVSRQEEGGNSNNEFYQGMNKLLCGISGPKRTEWEGGLYPVLLEWTDRALPPVCKFPKHFHHANVCPTTGIVMLSTFRSPEWHPEISIPEILFDLQQLLAHPNHDENISLSKEEQENYQVKIRIQNSMYEPNSLLLTAQDIDGFGESRLWQLVDGDALLCDRGRHENSNVVHVQPGEPEFNGSLALRHGQREVCKARCSCCAYGQSLWDEEHEMRFIFGTGMSTLS